jgi:hypothetical protein
MHPDDDTTTYDSEANVNDPQTPDDHPPGDLDHTRFSASPIPDAVIAGGAWLFVVGALVCIGAALLAAIGMPL